MSSNITSIADTDTFGTWKTRTNELITSARKSVTMTNTGGTPGDNNQGDISLNGDFSLEQGHTITVDNIAKTAGGARIALKNETKVEGNLVVDPGSAEATIKIDRAGSNKWSIKTTSSGAELSIVNESNASYLRIGASEITTSNLTISDNALPATITKKIAHTGTGNNGSSFADCDIGAGIIVATKISSTGTNANSSDFAEVDIDGGSIDGTAIGANSQSTGSFTSVSTTGNGNYTAGGSGGFLGDLKTRNGATVVDVDANTPRLYGEADSLTASGITAVLQAVYPIGSLYTSTTGVDPSTARAADNTGGLGFGTWERYAEGRTLVGHDNGAAVTGTITLLANTFRTIRVTIPASARNKIDGNSTTLDSGSRFSVGDELDIRFQYDGYSGSGVETGYNLPVDSIGVVKEASANEITIIVGSSASDNIKPTVSASNRTFTVTNFRIRNKRFDLEDSGGRCREVLETEHVPDHIHSNIGWNNEQFYLYNDQNAAISETGIDRAQGPSSDADAHRYQYSGKVYGREIPGVGVEAITVGQSHNNTPPYVAISIWRRTA